MRKGLAGASIAVALVMAAPAAALTAGDYSTAPFTTTTNAYAFGQAPVFTNDGTRVLFGKDFKTGEKNQVYIADWPSGAHLSCLTCTGDPVASDPNNVNGVPAVQPGGDWVIFHSWRGHYMTIGSPGYGGMGSALWALNLNDPSKQYQLSDVQATGATPGNGEGIDDYHAYWSPDGTQIEWAHLNWNFVDGGGTGSAGAGHGTWDVKVADFTVKDGVPGLTNIRTVRPDNGHWYETQWWNPDPSQPGFLYTESYGRADTNTGAVTPQLFYCQLVPDAAGNPESACKVTRLTDNASWDEQAIFTPDSKDVIFMSSRDQPGIFNTWASATRMLGIPADYDYLLILPLFEAGFLQPVGQESTDLYEINLATRSVRQLTTDGQDGWITPEFTWDPANQHLVWTENRFPDGYRYPFPPNASEYAASLETLAMNPPPISPDISSNGVGVASVPVEQRTEIGTFDLGR